jgi:hypothetical protein
MRSDRGEEAIGLVLDQLPDDAECLPLRAKVDLVRAGLHGRRRSTPPLSVWAEVLVADPRNRRGLVPDSWRPWLLDWLHAPRWRARYTATCAALLAVVYLAAWPVAAIGDDPPGKIVTGVSWVAIIAIIQHLRAPQWRWAIALRNGLVPDGLRPFPAEATRVGYVRSTFSNRSALASAAAVSVISVLLLVANVVASALTPARQHGPTGLSGTVVLALAQVIVLLVVVVRPALGRVAAAGAAVPCVPDQSACVDPVRSRAGRLGWSAIALIGGSWMVVFAGTLGAVVFAAIGVGAGVEAVSIARRQRCVQRRLGMWEVWPVMGPQPVVLVRPEVLAAEGLGGAAARGSRWPEGFA